MVTWIAKWLAFDNLLISSFKLLFTEEVSRSVDVCQNYFPVLKQELQLTYANLNGHLVFYLLFTRKIYNASSSSFIMIAPTLINYSINLIKFVFASKESSLKLWAIHCLGIKEDQYSLRDPISSNNGRRAKTLKTVFHFMSVFFMRINYLWLLRRPFTNKILSNFSMRTKQTTNS